MDVLGPTFWAEDAIAVMDAVGCEQATIFGSEFHCDERDSFSPPITQSGCAAS